MQQTVLQVVKRECFCSHGLCHKENKSFSSGEVLQCNLGLDQPQFFRVSLLPIVLAGSTDTRAENLVMNTNVVLPFILALGI